MTPHNPAQPWWRSFKREHWFVFIVAALAWLFDCFDQQIFNLTRGGAMEALLADKSKATEYGSYTTSVFLIGWSIGGLIFGALGDRFGRARMLTWTILLYSLSTGLNAFSTGFVDFCVYRFITGLGVGGVFGLAVALVADSVPDHTRAPALGLLQALSTVGNLAAGGIGMAVGALGRQNLLPFGFAAWQSLFLIGALPALLSVFVLTRLKEPAKWVAARDASALRGIKLGSYATLLFHPKWRKNAWIGLIACTAGIIGLWGIGNFHPQIVGDIIARGAAARGLTGDALAGEKAYWQATGLLLQNIGGFLGMLSLAKLAQTWGRRPAFARFLPRCSSSSSCVSATRCIGCCR
jgi:MFS family permease